MTGPLSSLLQKPKDPAEVPRWMNLIRERLLLLSENKRTIESEEGKLSRLLWSEMNLSDRFKGRDELEIFEERVELVSRVSLPLITSQDRRDSVPTTQPDHDLPPDNPMIEERSPDEDTDLTEDQSVEWLRMHDDPMLPDNLSEEDHDCVLHASSGGSSDAEGSDASEPVRHAESPSLIESSLPSPSTFAELEVDRLSDKRLRQWMKHFGMKSECKSAMISRLTEVRGYLTDVRVKPVPAKKGRKAQTPPAPIEDIGAWIIEFLHQSRFYPDMVESKPQDIQAIYSEMKRARADLWGLERVRSFLESQGVAIWNSANKFR